MFQSTEVRWFSDKPYSDIEAWFSSKGLQLQQASERTDFYQGLESDVLGIKLREGRIETKKRIQQLGPHEFSATVHGNIEAWRKWSFLIEKSDKEANGIFANNSNDWLAVKKERIGVKAIFQNGWKYLPMSDFPDNGIQIEYTRLTVFNHVIYTFCLEAFGEKQPDIADYPLVEIVNESILLRENSYSYPKLLRTLL